MKIFQLFLLLVCIHASGQQKTICISVDDLPTVNYGIQDLKFNKEITQKLITAFDEYHIPAIGFVNESKLYKKGELQKDRIALLEMWLKNGYELGNHTFSHHNYDKVDFETYSKDLLKGEKITKALAKTYQVPYRYFRHPYLRMGSTQERADSLSNFIIENNYTIAPVTLDNSDYLFAKAYHNAFKAEDKELMLKIGSDYIAYMESKLHFYESRSQELFGRNIPQIHLCHASLLNADYMAKLAIMYQRNGYTFIDQSKALEDPAYSTPISKFGPWGISWIDRWALSQGKKGDFFKDDPETPAYIVELSSK
ncbi:Polysaccharide deacetylase [Spirosomataceae bacterium TFI 002]|nr:Polysaccharide deacetylase [Spirosomataceae bacterium TFI 002]